MIARRFLHLSLSLAVGLIALVAISATLNPIARAATTAIHVYPDLLPPCNTTLQACVDGSADGDVIQIRPGTYTTSVTLYKPVSLIGLGVITPTTLIAPLNDRVLTVTGAVITASTMISNLHFTGGRLTGADCAGGACGGAIWLAGTARPTLARLWIDDNSAYQGGGLWAAEGPEVVIVDSKIISNSASAAGGGIYSGSSVRLMNVLIERNQSTDNGGGMDVSGSLDAANTVVVSNTSSNGGGGARVANGAVLNLGRWEGNVTGGMGGGLFANNLSMTGTLFINNQANTYGGGAYINGPGQLKDGRFERNRALGTGGAGGLFAGQLQASGTQFVGNTANGSSTAWGGGAYVSSDVAELNLVRFENNSALGAGGGLFGGGPVTLTNSTLLNNSANMGNGGGVYAGGSLVIKDSRLENNVSSFSSGGGAYAQSSASVADTAFVSNSASFRGGGLLVSAGADVQRSQFLHNTGLQSGGGLDVEGALGITNSVFISNTSSIGGGVYHNVGGDGRVVNSLFARNIGSASGASALQLASTGHVDVIHTTIADPAWVYPDFNPAPAIRNESGSLNITDTIIADHSIGIFNNGGGAAYEDYNLFSSVGTIISGLVTPGGHDQYPALPQFVDSLNDNYHLRPTSAAIDHGTDAGVHFDIDGNPRPLGPGFDIGFDEAFTSIQQAIDYTPPGGTVEVLPGVYTESLTLNKPVNLIGAGTTQTIIGAVSGQRVLTITGGAITASTIISGLSLVNGQSDSLGGGVLITDHAMPTLMGMQISDNNAVMGGGLYIDTGGAIMMNSQVVRNAAMQSGGGAYVAQSGGTFLDVYSTVFDNNTAIDGAGVFVQSGTFRAFNSYLVNNQANHWGGGVLIGSGGNVYIQNSQLSFNSTISLTGAGGGVLVDAGQFDFVSGKIYSNTSIYGGGVYLSQPGAVFTQTGGTVDGNSAVAGGGYYLNQGQVVLGGGTVISNRATFGGGVYINNGGVQLQSTALISNNTASAFGGGVYVGSPGATLMQLGGTIQSNTAPDGGGVKITEGHYALWGGQVSQNTATGQGGGVLLDTASADFAQYGGLILGNRADMGGGVYVLSGTATIGLGALIYSNTAASFGGGLYLADGAATLNGDIAANAAKTGGGVYLNSPLANFTQGVGSIAFNYAHSGSGGGLYIQRGHAALTNGRVVSNTADANGGGIEVGPLGDLQVKGLSRISGNTALGTVGGGGVNVLPGGQAVFVGGRVEDNTTAGFGGGLNAQSGVTISGTRFLNNTANDGYAIYHAGGDDGHIVNALVADNHGPAANWNGASVSLNSTGQTQLAFSTLANSASPSGRAVDVNGGGLRLVNSIVASYTIGISQTVGPVSEDYNLFFGNGISLTGAITLGVHTRSGLDPQFIDPAAGDYHIRSASPAINHAADVGVHRDFDFDARPIGGGYDIGADETLGAGVVITPGGNVTTTLYYTNTNGGSTSIFIPPGAVSGTVSNTFSFYYTVISTDSITTPLPARLILSGDPFELDAFIGNDLTATQIITFNSPVTIRLHYVEADLNGISEQTLKLYRLEYPPFGNGWCVIGVCRPNESQTLDTVNNIITATVTGFSRWGTLGSQYAFEVFLPVILK